jgi:hypothetical protein
LFTQLNKNRHNYTLFYYIGFLVILATSALMSGELVSAQSLSQWSSQQRIPGYQSETWPPILMADQNRTVHALSSQWFGEDEGSTDREIVYSQWTLQLGWTNPVDILLSPLKNDARLTDAYLDQSGMLNAVFFGGDGTDANIYYSQAPAVDAGKASAWLEPVIAGRNAQDPENAAFWAEDPSNFGILYSGNPEGLGLYVVYSTNGGDNWSDPTPIYIISGKDLLVNELKMYKSQSGWLYALWNTITTGGQGRKIYFAKSKIGDKNWSDPVLIAQAQAGYGTNTPAIIEYQGQILAFYNLSGKIWMVSSGDGGVSWTIPSILFRRHVGVNGSLSLVVDSNQVLHLFFGQRIASPEIHGMWHSIWQAGRWWEPEPVVSGPAIADNSGDNAFDPFEARAMVSQGNVILVTWRSDPGLKGNGVWYSFKKLDAPELPLKELPPFQPTPTPASTLTNPSSAPSSGEGTANQSDYVSASLLSDGSAEVNNPVRPLIIGIIPVLFLIFGAILVKKASRY